MRACDISAQILFAWADGEAGTQTEAIALHQSMCRHCRQRLHQLHEVQKSVARGVQGAADNTEALVTLQLIREDMVTSRGLLPRLHEAAMFLRVFKSRSLSLAAGCAGMAALTAWLALVCWP